MRRLLVACLIAPAVGAIQVHKIEVGNGGFRYNPNVTYAAVGDVVQFAFFPPNHSVVRGDFAGTDGEINPCVPYELYHPGTKDHFFSGLVNVSAGEIEHPPTWNITVKDTKPIWFYCNAINSCHPNGMVGVINPPYAAALAVQEQAAKNAQYQLNPGDTFPAEGEMPTATGTLVPSPGMSSSNGGQSSNGSRHKSQGLSDGAIAGIAVSISLLFHAALGAAFYFYRRSRMHGSRLGSPSGSLLGGFNSSGRGGTASWVNEQQHAAAGYYQQQQQHAKMPSVSTTRASMPETTASAEMTGVGLGMSGTRSYPCSVIQSPNTPFLSPHMASVPPCSPELTEAMTGAHFVGFNRQSGRPDFAFEVGAADEHQLVELANSNREKRMEEGRDPTTGRVELPT